MVTYKEYLECKNNNQPLFFVDWTYEKVIQVDTSQSEYYKDDIIRFYNNSELWWEIKLNKLFIDKHDAEWDLKMTATEERTIKIPLWEEFKDAKKIYKFVCFDGMEVKMSISSFSYIKNDKWIDSKSFIRVSWNEMERFYEFSKDGYTKAAELCIKIFKGELDV